MALEIPLELIRQVQAGFRRDAGVPSYDLTGPSLTPLPSIADAVASLDPDLPPSLRCSRCSGPLLRGLQSTLCIYCGADRSSEGLPQTISFNSTVGCRKLLEYLGLDGSEAVVLETESSSSSKGQATPKDELTLFNLLDLPIKWPSDKEETDNDITSKDVSSDTYALSLTGFDIDTFFSEKARREKAYASFSEPDEEFMLREQSRDTRKFSSSHLENLSAFESLQTSDVKTSSSNLESIQFSNSFTDWEAEFQSASSITPVTDPQSHDLFQDSSVHDLAYTARTGDIVGKNPDKKHETSSKVSLHGPATELSLPSSVENWIQGDNWPMGAAELNTNGQPKDETNGDELKNDLNIVSFKGDHWFQDDLRLKNKNMVSDNSVNAKGNEDLFDEWKDFMSSNEAKGNELDPGAGTTSIEHPSEKKANDLGPTSSPNEVDNKVVYGNEDFFDSWKDFTSSSEVLGNVLNPGAEPTSLEHPSETKSTGLWHTNSTNELDNSKLLYGNSDHFDDWHNFTISGQHKSLNVGAESEVTLFEHSPETKLIDQFPTTGKIESGSSTHIKSNDGGLDDWKGFPISNQASANLLNHGIQSEATLLEHSSGVTSEDLWPSSSIKELDNSNDGNDDSFDDWQDFTSSGTGQERSFSLMEKSSATLFEQPFETNSVDMWHTAGKMESANGQNESIDDWKDFSSAEAQGSLVSSGAQPEVVLFGNPPEAKPNHQHDMLFENFLQSDPTLDALAGQKYSHKGEDIGLEASYPDREKGKHQETVVDLSSIIWDEKDIVENSNDTSNAESTEDTIKKLISQMPDLSFMLVNELRVPE